MSPPILARKTFVAEDVSSRVTISVADSRRKRDKARLDSGNLCRFPPRVNLMRRVVCHHRARDKFFKLQLICNRDTLLFSQSARFQRIYKSRAITARLCIRVQPRTRCARTDGGSYMTLLPKVPMRSSAADVAPTSSLNVAYVAPYSDASSLINTDRSLTFRISSENIERDETNRRDEPERCNTIFRIGRASLADRSSEQIPASVSSDAGG